MTALVTIVSAVEAPLSEPVVVALIGLGVAAVGGGGTALGAWLAGRATKGAAVASARAQVKTSEDNAQDRLIDQLQQELDRYRSDADERAKAMERRVEMLEDKVERQASKIEEQAAHNSAYRAFIGVQRDHMAEHGVPLPPWPDDLPR